MSRKVLVIDDDNLLRKLLRSYLTSQGWKVQEASTFHEGLRKALEEVPSVILLDVKLPDGDGFGLCRKLKEEASLKSVPVLLMSGERKEEGYRILGLGEGAIDYVLKPVHLELLAAKLNALERIGKEA